MMVLNQIQIYISKDGLTLTDIWDNYVCEKNQQTFDNQNIFSKYLDYLPIGNGGGVQ